jgi:hypothetical protein
MRTQGLRALTHRIAIGVMLVLTPTGALAQTGYYATPSLSIGELYDDNLFFSSSQRQQDFFTRISPSIQAGYQSTPLTVLGRYTFDSEIYHKHSELNAAQVRQQGSIELKATPTQVLTLSVAGSYFRTNTASELNLQTGLAVRRALAERYTANPAFIYRFDPLTTARGDYTYTKDLLAGGITIDSHIVNVDLGHRIDPRNTVGPVYIGRQFVFAGSGTITSHAFTIGWSHDLTPLTKITLRGGPRVLEGTVDDQPEALASIRHTLQDGELSFTYTNTATTTFGLTGTQDAQNFAGDAAYNVTSRLRVNVRPSVFTVSSPSFSSTVYLMNAEATYQLTKWLSLTGSYQISLQRGSFNPLSGSTGGGEVEILRNVTWLRLIVTYPARLD